MVQRYPVGEEERPGFEAVAITYYYTYTLITHCRI
jgi:hypothetical protein